MSEQSLGFPWKLNPVWEVLTDQEKELVHQEVEVFHFKKNDVIHYEGDTPRKMMMLVSGKVRIYKEGNSQRQQIIRLLKPYDFFGYRAIIAGDQYTSGAAAFEPSVVYMLKKETFLHLLKTNVRFCYEMMRILSKDLAHSEIQTVNLTQKHIRGRLAESILSLKFHYGLESDQETIAIAMSREDLANMSNMTTSNAIRTLSQFIQEGLVRSEGKKIAILDEEELNRISRMG